MGHGRMVRICGTTSVERQHTHMSFSRAVRRTKSRNMGVVYTNSSLLQSSKLIFQASKNHTNFYVDTRNQEQPILLGIGRKAFVGLK